MQNWRCVSDGGNVRVMVMKGTRVLMFESNRYAGVLFLCFSLHFAMCILGWILDCGWIVVM